MKYTNIIASLVAALLLNACGGGSSGDSGGGTSLPVACAAPTAIEPDDTISGSLASSDCTIVRLFPSETGDQSLLDQYEVTLPTAGELTVTMRSTDFDAFLILFDSPPTIPPIAEDDDSGGGLDAMITADLAAGTYLIVANSATLTAVTGPYTLTTSFRPVVWSPVTDVGSPEARTEHTAVWSDMEMIVWGGQNFVIKDSGAKYDPAGDSWTPVTQTGAPSPRTLHTVVWTGSEMIVWGGFTGALAFETIDDGARYDPQTDSWSLISAVNQPSPRASHTAVWSGSEMLVWGGRFCLACANGELGTGARYDPATDTWTPIATLNAPEARFNHTAIWTGSKMIIWGGASDRQIGSLTVLDNGGIYDPATDSWTAITTVGAPLPTRCHVAVWTGTEMIVFGGQNNTNFACGILSVNTGRRYDPVSNTWNPMADAPLGSSSSGPAAIWSGDRMITWFDNVGGRYDPVTDLWQGVSIDNAPSARKRHTVVWTGTRMIVWGGDFAGPLGTGAIYDPRFDSTP